MGKNVDNKVRTIFKKLFKLTDRAKLTNKATHQLLHK
jgi:hypothetical protein